MHTACNGRQNKIKAKRESCSIGNLAKQIAIFNFFLQGHIPVGPTNRQIVVAHAHMHIRIHDLKKQIIGKGTIRLLIFLLFLFFYVVGRGTKSNSQRNKGFSL